MSYSSILLENAVESIARLPGIGRKTALRLALHLLRQPKSATEALVTDLTKLVEGMHLCKQCHNLSDQEVCAICRDEKRNGEVICVVEDIRDVMAIENTGTFSGLYHVLGGLINPLEGMGPGDIKLHTLIPRIAPLGTKEILLALSATPEGDTTAFFVFKMLKEQPVQVSVLARGVAIGDQLEYADQVTLSRSIAQRIPFEQSYSGK